ncbi:LysM peptidoglycan-binding domain-containing protein [Kineosporia sp. NBRC 101731]|uniref:LysM peptidoglycan-binding domain-containing protein n=1 Tax=Kineosporia sp. NBRC 101731 TaxID=3032199 RepID=UPI00332963AA
MGHHVVVKRGDTLWSIAAQHLGPGANDVDIAHEWPRWYQVNRHLIGADPHKLLPGERLRSPDLVSRPATPEQRTRAEAPVPSQTKQHSQREAGR